MNTTIGIDIDDTIAVHIPEIVAFSNEHYGTNLTIDTYEETWQNFWNVDFAEVERRAQIFHDKTIMKYQRVDDSVDVLRRLAQKNRLVVVTARPQYAIDPTYQWLEQYFNGLFDEVHFVPIWDANSTATKAAICKAEGIDYLIDDIPRHCNDAAQAGVGALLFGGYTWSSKEEVHPDVVRVNSWKAVGEYFDV